MDFLINLFGKKPSHSKDIARDRLKLVLIHDRADCSTQLLEMLRADIFKVISNYMEIDEGELDIQISQQNIKEGDSPVPVLFANIPIKSIRKPRS